MRLGVFGGTFDPPHIGHLAAAQDALTHLRLDRVLFVPAAQPPHKADRALTPAAIRLELVRAAVAGDERFVISTLELDREGPSYTVETLRELRAAQPAAELVLLMGADQYAEFRGWRAPGDIEELATLAVLGRAGALSAADGRISHVPVTRIDVSSTEIRQRVRGGAPIRYLVPAAVEEVIRRHRLYL